MPLPNDALRLSADSVWFFGRSCWGRVPRPVVPLLRDHRGHACLHLAADPPERHLGGTGGFDASPSPSRWGMPRRAASVARPMPGPAAEAAVRLGPPGIREVSPAGRRLREQNMDCTADSDRVAPALHRQVQAAARHPCSSGTGPSAARDRRAAARYGHGFFVHNLFMTMGCVRQYVAFCRERCARAPGQPKCVSAVARVRSGSAPTIPSR